MTENPLEKKSDRKKCDGCGGSGQIAFFRGVSRFVMDWDDCPDCLGTGYTTIPETESETDSSDNVTEPSD
jgi:DnaJ-class molecular chaperone